VVFVVPVQVYIWGTPVMVRRGASEGTRNYMTFGQ